MGYFPDLAPGDYFGGMWPPGKLLAVGWIEAGRPYAKGAVSSEVFEKLMSLLVHPWAPVAFAGFHRCELCRFTGTAGPLLYRDHTVSVGANNLFVPAAELTYAAPSTIAHYIDAHEYAPPPAFQAAILACPEMRSMAYLRAIKASGFVLPLPSSR